MQSLLQQVCWDHLLDPSYDAETAAVVPEKGLASSLGESAEGTTTEYSFAMATHKTIDFVYLVHAYVINRKMLTGQ